MVSSSIREDNEEFGSGIPLSLSTEQIVVAF